MPQQGASGGETKGAGKGKGKGKGRQTHTVCTCCGRWEHAKYECNHCEKLFSCCVKQGHLANMCHGVLWDWDEAAKDLADDAISGKTKTDASKASVEFWLCKSGHTTVDDKHHRKCSSCGMKKPQVAKAPVAAEDKVPKLR